MLTCCQLYCECRGGVGVAPLRVILPKVKGWVTGWPNSCSWNEQQTIIIPGKVSGKYFVKKIEKRLFNESLEKIFVNTARSI